MNNEPLQLQEPKISAIVCAYNEEQTIPGVMDTLLRSPSIHEVFAVDDGSSDRTARLLSRYRDHPRAHIILLPENQGKGCAMTTAAGQAGGEIFLLVDADLKNLTTEHVDLLLAPILAGQADMVIGFPIRDKAIRPAEWLDPCRPLSGQRALYRRDFMPLVDTIRCSGYGVETILNLHFRQQNKVVQTIFLPYLVHPIKVEKGDLATALAGYSREGREILETAAKNPRLVWGALRSALVGR